MEKTKEIKKFGMMAGVFTPTFLTILGVIMYIRHPWVVGNAGVLGALLIIIVAVAITLSTALSLSSITTNIRIGSGGAFSLISQSLGLYISERNEGPFKDAFITFNSTPELIVVAGTLAERHAQVQRLRTGGSTNLQGVYQLILKKAKEGNVPQSEMPTMIIIFSDMEFNQGASGHAGSTAQEMVE